MSTRLLLISVLCVSCGHPAPAPPPPVVEEAAEEAISASPLLPLALLESGRADATTTVIALHGLGDRPERFMQLLEGLPLDIRVLTPAAPIPYGRGLSWFDYTPDDPAQTATGIAAAADQVADLIEALALPEPPIVTGFSQGGMISFALAVRHPSLIRAALPLSGMLPPSLWPSDPDAPVAPLLALHGEADPRVRLDPTRDAVAHLRALGVPAALRTYPDVGHSISADMRRDLFEALSALSAPCALLTPLPDGEAITRPLVRPDGAVALTVGSLVRPLPVGLDCPDGQRGVQVVSEDDLYRLPESAGVTYAAVAAAGCMAAAALAPVERLIPRPPPPGEAALFGGGEVFTPEDCAIEGISQLQPATLEQVAAVQQVRDAWSEAFGGGEAPAVGVSAWGRVRLPLVAMSEAEIGAEMIAERLVTPAQREKVTTAWGPHDADGVPIYSHFTGADARFSDAWGQPEAVAAWLRLAAGWAERCPATVRRACTLQLGDLAWYSGRQPDPLGHIDHWPGWCADVRLFREDGSRYEALWNRADDREGATGGYSQSLTLAFLRYAVAEHPVSVVYFNDPAARTIEGVAPLVGHDDHIHLCIRSGGGGE